MEINLPKTVKTDVKTLKLHIKIRDELGFILTDDKDELVFEREEGYVPGFFPGEHYGDYLIFDIDIETGQIKNWQKPSVEDVEEIVLQRDE